MWSKMFANAIVSLLCNNCRNSCCCRCSPQWHHWKLQTPWSIISYIFRYSSCIFMLYHEDHLIQSPDPSLHSALCSLWSVNRDSDPVPACPFRSNTSASLASDWTKEVGCGSGSSVRPWEDWQPSKGPVKSVKPSSCWESMPSGDASTGDLGQAPMTRIYRFLIVSIIRIWIAYNYVSIYNAILMYSSMHNHPQIHRTWN